MSRSSRAPPLNKLIQLLKERGQPTLPLLVANPLVERPPRGGDQSMDLSESEATRALHSTQLNMKSNIKGYEYAMCGHAEACVDKYLGLAGTDKASLKPVATPTIDDHHLSDEDVNTTGALAPVYARVVLKAFYLARKYRIDCPYAVSMLAREVTRWNVACDKRLHRLMRYIPHTTNWIQFCWVGDKLEDCFLALFCDSGFAADLKDLKSTSGAVLVLVGPRTWVPIG